MLWRILSVSTGLIAFFGVIVAEMLGERAEFQRFKELLALAFVVAGIALWVVGKRRAAQRAKAADEQPPSDEPDVVASKMAFLTSQQYWGTMLAIFAAIVFLANPPNLSALSFLKISNFKLPTPAPAPGKKAPERVVEPVPPVAPIQFPKMKLQGLTAGGARPNAIINAKTYFIGDRLGEAVVTVIDRHSVTLELGGQTKVLNIQQ